MTDRNLIGAYEVGAPLDPAAYLPFVFSASAARLGLDAILMK